MTEQMNDEDTTNALETLQKQRENDAEHEEALNHDILTSYDDFKKNRNGAAWRNNMTQILACCAVHSLVIQVGIHMAYSAILLPTLSSNDSYIQIDINDASWIASLATITTPIGSIATGPLMDLFGRKYVCLLTTMPFIISWIFLATAGSVWSIYMGRILAGFGSGLSSAAIVYVSEVSNPLLRPMLLCLNSVFVSFGILLVCVFSLWFSWKSMAYFFEVLIVVSFIVIFPQPESPQWLVSSFVKTGKSKYKKQLERSLKWFQKSEEFMEMEIARLLDIKHSSKTGHILSIYDVCHAYTEISTFKPMAILFFIFFFQQLSGTYVVIFYAVDIFKKVGGNFGAGINEYSALVMLGIIRFLMSGIVAFLSQSYGRRPLCIMSGSSMAVMSFVVAAYLQIVPTMEDGSRVCQWIPLVGLLMYVCASALGYLVIPWTLIGEILPLKVRGTGGGLMISLAYFIMFGVIKSFPYLVNVVGIIVVFYFFTFMSLCGVLFIYIFLPETLGKSLQEIENYFR